MLTWIRRDTLLCLYLLTAAALWLPGLFVSWGWIDGFGVSYFVNACAIVMGIVACLFRGGKSAPATSERAFFGLTACALTAWLLSLVLQYVIAADWSEHPQLSVLGDICYGLIYLFFLLAIEQKPHASVQTELRPREQSLAALGSTLFVVALFAYSVILPALKAPGYYLSWIPSHHFYLLLDLSLVARLVAAAIQVSDASCRRTYAWFAAACLVWMSLDGICWLRVTRTLEVQISSRIMDCFWFLTPILIAIGARVPREPWRNPRSAGSEREELPQATWAGSLGLQGGLILLVHGLSESLDPRGLEFSQIRSWIVLVALFTMAVLIYLSRVQILSENSRLRQENQIHLDRTRAGQRIAWLARLTGGIAHDFNNLLQVMRSCSEELVRGLRESGDLRREAQAILVASEQGTQLTNQLLAMTRAPSQTTTTVDLNETVTRVVGLMRRLVDKQVTIEVQLAAEAGRVEAPPGQLEQALLNLGMNARDALESRGTIRFETTIASVPDRDGILIPHLAIVVRDDGQGMDAFTKAHLFEPFFTTKAGGTGLGLSTVKSLMEELGGRIEVESKLDPRPSFRLLFPLRSSQERPMPHASAQRKTEHSLGFGRPGNGELRH